MSVQMNMNGYSYNLVDENDLEWLIEARFPVIFDRYLITRYGINSEQLKRILAAAAPEEFL